MSVPYKQFLAVAALTGLLLLRFSSVQRSAQLRHVPLTASLSWDPYVSEQQHTFSLFIAHQ